MGNIRFMEEWLDFHSYPNYNHPKESDVELCSYVSVEKYENECNNTTEHESDGYHELCKPIRVAKNPNAYDTIKSDHSIRFLNSKPFDDYFAGLNISKELSHEDKENNHPSIRSRTSAYRARDFNTFLCKLQNKSYEEIVTNSERGALQLDELPEFKSKNKTKAYKQDSLTINPELLDDSDGVLAFYNDIRTFPDDTWLPRHFQHHRLKLNLFQGADPIYRYFKNPLCPKSRDCDQWKEDFTAVSMFARNAEICRYTRRSKFSKRTEVMCRLCRGKNWILNNEFNQHLAFSHGILIPQGLNINTSTALLPLPKSLFTSKTRKFVNMFVKCPDCGSWIKLGSPASNKVQDPSRKSCENRNGLYHSYFLHYLKSHKLKI